jgi:putative hydrolase of the HAD superfamily
MLSQVLCIAFDAVGTLISPDPPVAEVYARVGRKHGSALSEEEVRERFREAFRIEHLGIATTSEFDEHHRWRRIVQRVFGLAEIELCFQELFDHFGRPESWRCFPEVAGTLGELSGRGYDLVLASNFDFRLHAICDGHPELACFSSRVISSEVGWFKPRAEFYRGMLETSGFQKHEVLMVGDDWQNDTVGAMEFGIKAIHVDRGQAEPVTRKDNVTVISSLRVLLDLLP